jgi:hypothetical protein
MANLLGGSVNVTPTTGIAPGKPYPLGSGLVGILDRGAVANQLTAVDITLARVVPIAKPTGAGTNYAQFATVSLFPVTPEGLAVTGATGVKLGIVAVQPATTDTTVQVLMIPGASL